MALLDKPNPNDRRVLLQKRRECEEKQNMKISFTNQIVSWDDIYESRIQLERELFEKVLRRRKSANQISEGMGMFLMWGLYCWVRSIAN